MTNKELNRDIKRLKIAVVKHRADNSVDNPKYYEQIEVFKKEFTRLYDADREFKVINRDNIVFMLRFNVLYRAIPFHQFGLMINI